MKLRELMHELLDCNFDSEIEMQIQIPYGASESLCVNDVYEYEENKTIILSHIAKGDLLMDEDKNRPSLEIDQYARNGYGWKLINPKNPWLSKIYYFKGPSPKFCPDPPTDSRAIIVGMERSGRLHGEFIDELKNSKNRKFSCMISELDKFFNRQPSHN